MGDDQSEPEVRSFDLATVRKEAKQAALTRNPVTLFAPIIGFLAGGGGFAFAQLLEPWMLAAAGTGGVVGLLSYVFDRMYLQDGRISKFVRERRQWLSGQTDRKAKRLRAHFEAEGETRALDRINELEHSYQDLVKLLNDRFRDGGLSKERFLGSAVRIRELTLAKFEQIADLEAAIQSIPIKRLRRELAGSELSKEQREAAEGRMAHFKEVKQENENTFGVIERALEKISAISIEVARVGSKHGEIESVLTKIERLTIDMRHFEKEI